MSRSISRRWGSPGCDEDEDEGGEDEDEDEDEEERGGGEESGLYGL